MWPMRKRGSGSAPSDVDGAARGAVERTPQLDETEMTPAPEALRHSASRALARLSGGGRRRAAAQLDGQVIGHGVGPLHRAARGVDGEIGDETPRAAAAETQAVGRLRRLFEGFAFVFGRLSGRA